MATNKTVLLTKNCAVCNTEFPVRPPGKTSRLCRTPYTAEFCSRECRHKARFRQGALCEQMTETQAAYIAGFLDGEGSIMLYKRRDSVALRVTFSNTNTVVLEWLKATCGMGSIVTFDGKDDRHKVSSWFQLNSDAASTLLEQVTPYLIIKQRQALLALEFQKKLHDPSFKSQREWQHAALEQMKDMNRRGPSHQKQA